MTASWYTAAVEGPEFERLNNAWNDAPFESLEVLGMLLDVAQEQVIAYAPKPVTPADQLAYLLAALGLADKTAAVLDAAGVTQDTPAALPTRYILGQLLQSKNLWNAGRVTPAGDAGPEGFVFTPRPMDKTIKQIIRPAEGGPRAF